jgi:hypothetical protein
MYNSIPIQHSWFRHVYYMWCVVYKFAISPILSTIFIFMKNILNIFIGIQLHFF